MNQIQQFPYSRLTNGNASILHEKTITNYMRLYEEHGTLSITPLQSAMASIVIPKVLAFNEGATNFVDIMRQRQGSGYTFLMAKLESERDREIRLGDRLVKNGLKSSNPETVVSSAHVDATWRTYGNLAKRQQEEQTQMTRKLLRDLRTPEMIVHVRKIPMLETALETIEASNEAFAQNTDNRTEQRNDVVAGLTAEARLQADNLAIDLVAAINVVASSFKNVLLSEVIQMTNTLLTEARHGLAARKRGRNLSQSHNNTDPHEEETSDEKENNEQLDN